MVYLWFVLAVILLIGAAVMLWLDRRQRTRRTPSAPDTAAPAPVPVSDSADAPAEAANRPDTDHSSAATSSSASAEPWKLPSTPPVTPPFADPAQFETSPSTDSTARMHKITLDSATDTADTSDTADTADTDAADTSDTPATDTPATDTPTPAADSARTQWLESRGFAPANPHGVSNEYRGRFRGAETSLIFAGRQLHISMRRPGPNRSEFTVERAASADPSGDVAEQMELRSTDESTDALLTDPRVISALRAAPPEFVGASIDPLWGHTDMPVDQYAAFDGAIVTLHAIIAAAAALPTAAGTSDPAKPFDFTHADPGSGAESRGETPPAGRGTITAPRMLLTDADSVATGDGELDDDFSAQVPPASTAGGAGNPDDAASTENPVSTASPTPDQVPLVPRTPGRPGHLRLVKTPADVTTTADETTADETTTDETTTDETTTDETTTADQPSDDAAFITDEPAASRAEDDEQQTAEPAQPSPFDAVMRADGVPANRGDVAADFLPERPAPPRPSRGTAASYGTGEPMPTLGEPAVDYADASTPEPFKALGASDNAPVETRDAIYAEMDRFEQTRLHPADTTAPATDVEDAQQRPGRHRDANPNALSIADLLARESTSESAPPPTTNPDFVETTRFAQIPDPNDQPPTAER